MRVFWAFAALTFAAWGIAATPPLAHAQTPSIATGAQSWAGFHVGISAGYMGTRNTNRMQYSAAQPNPLAFAPLRRLSGFSLVDPAVRALSPPTLASFSGPFPLLPTANAPVGYYGTFTNTNGGTTPPNNTAQINDRSVAASQAALDAGVLAGALPGNLAGGPRDLATGGVSLGYNWAFSRFVAGLQADFSAIDRVRADSFGAVAPVVVGVVPLPVSLGGGDFITADASIVGQGKTQTLWLATFRGRLGVAFDKTFVYATGGLAVGRVKSSATLAANGALLLPAVDAVWSGSDAKNRAGWALGFGLQYAVSEHWSVGVEYLRYDLGRRTYGLAADPASAALRGAADYAVGVRASARAAGDIFRVGVQYRFGL